MIRDFFVSNVAFNITTFVLAVLGIVFTVYFSLKARRVKCPRFCIRMISLLKTKVSKIESLKIFYDGKELDDLSTAKIVFWNSGKETIFRDDISSIDPLRISVGENSEILSCDVLAQSKVANDFSVVCSSDKKSVLLSFDYLDVNEGAVIITRINSREVVHLEGSIKSVKHIKDSNPQKAKTTKKEMKHFVIIAKIAIVLLIVLSIALGIIITFKLPIIVDAEGILLKYTALRIFIGGIYIFTGIWSILQLVFHRRRIPKELEDKFLNSEF